MSTKLIRTAYVGNRYLFLAFHSAKIIRVVRVKDSRSIDIKWRETIIERLIECEKLLSLNKERESIDELGKKFFSSSNAAIN